MKRIFTLVAASILLYSANTFSQSDSITSEEGMVVIDHSKDDFKTILGSGQSHGGYISFDLQTGQTKDNQNLLELGGRLGWIMNHGFTFGLAGYGFTGNVKKEVTYINPISSSGNDGITSLYNIGGGYGGIFVEPIVLPKTPVHVSFPIFFGVGGIGYYEPFDLNNNDYNYNYGSIETSVVTVFKPGVDLEFNITRFFRLGISANYRLVSNLELTLDETKGTMLDPDYLNGFNYGFSLKFGWF